jgi:N-acyl homoserine lactone hydrolase
VTDVRRLVPICTAFHRYDRGLSLRSQGGEMITAPILAYLIETRQGRILYDVGCDYRKIADPALRARHHDTGSCFVGAPDMAADERLPVLLAGAGISHADVDLVVLGHLHFDHAGGLADFAHAEIHVHPDELAAARRNADGAYFQDELAGAEGWRVERAPSLCAGVACLDSPGHTAGHRSLLVEIEDGPAVILAGDAADLQANIDSEIVPGILWEDREDLALASIRQLKALAQQERAELWPNHDLAHWQRLQARGWPVLASPRRLSAAVAGP